MVHRQLLHVLREIRKRTAPTASPSDRELLERYLAGRDETAFTALVERHGGLVLNVCRRLLPSEADAEDVCQGVFLVLARKAGSIRKKDSVSAWLHGTAYRLAANLRRGLARRRQREQPLVEAAAVETADPSWREVRAILDEELQRLPQPLLLPLLLCYLEGKTRDEAAHCLGWSVGTLRGRLERGRDLLRKRLTRRGLGLSAALLAASLTENVLAANMPAEKAVMLSRAALAYVSGAASGAASAHAVALAEGMVRAMFLVKVKGVAACLTVGLLLLGGGVAMWAAPRADQESERARVTAEEPQGLAVPRPATPHPPQAKAEDKPDAKAEVGWRSRAEVKGLNALGVPVFSADGKTMVVLDSASNSVQLRDPRTGELRKAIEVKGMKLVPGFAVSADGGAVAVHGATFHGYFASNRLALLDTRTGEETQIVANDPRTDRVYDSKAYNSQAVVSPDGRRVAWFVGSGYELFLWDRTTRKVQQLPRPRDVQGGHLTLLAFSPDGKTLATAVGSKIYFHDAVSGEGFGPADAKVYASAMAFTPDGKSLAVAGVEWPSVEQRDRVQPVVNVLDVGKRQLSKSQRGKTIFPNPPVTPLLFSAPSAPNWWVISDSGGARLIGWDLVTGAEEILSRDAGFCWATVSPDGTTLAVVRPSADRKTNVLSLWQRGGRPNNHEK